MVFHKKSYTFDVLFNNKDEMLDLKQLTVEVCRIATEAGHFLKEERKNFRRERVMEKHAHDYVSYVDKESEVRLVKALSALLPEAGFITEEGSATYQDEPYCWVIDPLDGTKEFIKRNGEFTVNIAYVKNGKPEAGVIYIPVKEELYFADSQYGAYKIEHITQLDSEETVDSLISKAHRLPYQEEAQRSSFIIVASRSHLTPETEAYIEEMKQKHQEVETVSKGSSLKLCLIAEGKADVYPRFAPTMEWDTAAGHAIIRAMGKEVYQAGTQHPLEYNKEDLLNPWFIAE